MRKKIKSLGPNVNVCMVSMNEAFSVGEACIKLHESFLKSMRDGSEFVACFQIHLGKFKPTEKRELAALIAKIDKFFFGLLVKHSVEDFSSGRSLCAAKPA